MKERPIITCKHCGEKREHAARRLCSTCYFHIKRGKVPGVTLDKYPIPDKTTITCKHCGEQVRHYSRRLCERCYWRVKRSRDYNLSDFPVVRAQKRGSEKPKPEHCCARYGCHNTKGSNVFGLCDKHITLITRKETA